VEALSYSDWQKLLFSTVEREKEKTNKTAEKNALSPLINFFRGSNFPKFQGKYDMEQLMKALKTKPPQKKISCAKINEKFMFTYLSALIRRNNVISPPHWCF
jgi:hypothetical protein